MASGGEGLERSSFADDHTIEFIAKNYADWPGTVSNTFTYKDDCWKLDIKRARYQSTEFEVHLHLINMSKSNLNTRMARLWCLQNQDENFKAKAVFNKTGDTMLLQFYVRDYLHCKDLTVVVQLTTGLLEMKSQKTPLTVPEPPKSQMAAVVLKWFETEDFGDTTVVAADGKQFRCHRDILSTRSEVFGRMFDCPMKESRENLVNIDGYEGDIVASLLQFVYSDDVGEIGPFADRLYVAADHYELDRLKILCESAMIANFSANSIVKTYRLAKLYNLEKLMTVCVDYWDSHKAEMSMADLLAVSLEIQ